MHLTIQGRNLEVTESLREHVEKKVGRLDRYLPSLTEGRVELREQNVRNAAQRFVVQITLQDRRGSILRGEERAGDVSAAVDAVVDKMHRQIIRFKGKRRDRYQRANGADENWGEEPPLALEEEAAEEEEARALVRTKRFALAPMNSEEAIEQMELLGHTFFVYYDADRGGVNVVYRRQDGHYGLIVPELI